MWSLKWETVFTQFYLRFGEQHTAQFVDRIRLYIWVSLPAQIISGCQLERLEEQNHNMHWGNDNLNTFGRKWQKQWLSLLSASTEYWTLGFWTLHINDTHRSCVKHYMFCILLYFILLYCWQTVGEGEQTVSLNCMGIWSRHILILNMKYILYSVTGVS